MAVRTVAVALLARMQGYTGPVRDGVRATREFGGELDALRRRAPGQFRDISMAAGGLGLAMAGLVGWALKTSMAFDKQMSEVQAVTNATAGELDQLREAALEAGKSTVFSATEAAKAQAELAKAGLTTAQILGGGLTGALSLAAAGTLDLAEAADIAAKTMNVFDLEASAVGHIADMLAGAANATATDVHEMGEALRMGGLAAHAAGMSMDDTVVTLGAFADSALVGSDAGTSLKTMLQMLAAPTERSSKLMRELGLNVYDAQGNFIGTRKLAGELQKSLGGLTQQQRNAALATIFGADAMRAANVLYGLGERGLADYNTRILEQADAAKTAAIKTDNLAGDVERLKGTLETLAIEASEGANGGLRFLVQALDSLVGWFADLPGPVQTAITVLAGVSGAGLLAAAGLMKIRAVGREAMQALRDMGPAGTAAATGLGKVGTILGKASLWGAGLYLVYEAATTFYDYLSKESGPVQRDIGGVSRSLKELADTGKVTGELAAMFGENFSKLPGQLAALKFDTAPLREFDRAALDAGNSAEHLTEDLGEMSAQADANHVSSEQLQADLGTTGKALAEMVRAGGATQAKLAFDQIAEAWRASGRPLADLNKLMPDYVTAAGEMAAANSGTAKGFGDVAGNARTMGQTLQDAIEKGQTLQQVFDQLNGAELSLSDSQIKAESTLRNFSSAIKESGGSLDITTEKGARARSALNDMARAAVDVAQKTYDQTGSTEAAQRAYDGYIKKLRDSVTGNKNQKAAINGVIDSISRMPPLKTVQIKVTVGVNTAVGPGLAALERRLANLTGQAAKLAQYADTNIGWKGQTGGPSGGKPTKTRAAGGWMMPGETYWVGERGPEPVTATRQAYVHPAGSVGAGRPTETVTRVIIDGTGVLSGLRKEIRIQGGVVQEVLGGR